MSNTSEVRLFALGAVLAVLPALAGADLSRLRPSIEALEKTLPGARLGVAVEDLATGETFGYRADSRFPMQSVFKLESPDVRAGEAKT